MANKQHLKLMEEAIIKKNIGIWNRWRHENPNVNVHLSGAKLIYVDLNAANIKRAILIGAELKRAKMVRANLRRAPLAL